MRLLILLLLLLFVPLIKKRSRIKSKISVASGSVPSSVVNDWFA